MFSVSFVNNNVYFTHFTLYTLLYTSRKKVVVVEVIVVVEVVYVVDVEVVVVVQID